MKRLAPIAVAIAVLLTACGASEVPSITGETVPTTADEITVPAGASEVFVLGDSLTVGVQPYLRRELARKGWRLTGVDARVFRTTAEGLRILRTKARRLPDTVLVALGANDVNATRAQVTEWVRSARSIVGDRRLIWINLHVDIDKAPSQKRYAVINDALETAAQQYDVEIADWHAWVKGHRVPMQADGVHYTGTGYRKRASFYARVVAKPAAS